MYDEMEFTLLETFVHILCRYPHNPTNPIGQWQEPHVRWRFSQMMHLWKYKKSNFNLSCIYIKLVRVSMPLFCGGAISLENYWIKYDISYGIGLTEGRWLHGAGRKSALCEISYFPNRRRLQCDLWRFWKNTLCSVQVLTSRSWHDCRPA